MGAFSLLSEGLCVLCPERLAGAGSFRPDDIAQMCAPAVLEMRK